MARKQIERPCRSVPRTVELARDADVLHAQAFQSVPPLAVARAFTGAPLVTTYHTSHFLKLAEKPFWNGVLGKLVAAGDHSLAASVEIARVGEGLAPGHAVEPLTNGVETTLFQRVEPTLPPPDGGRRRVIVPRRLFHKNGVEYFIRAVPLIALTAHAMASDRERALSAGCDDFDTKPVELPRLLGKMEALLKAKGVTPPEKA